MGSVIAEKHAQWLLGKRIGCPIPEEDTIEGGPYGGGIVLHFDEMGELPHAPDGPFATALTWPSTLGTFELKVNGVSFLKVDDALLCWLRFRHGDATTFGLYLHAWHHWRFDRVEVCPL